MPAPLKIVAVSDFAREVFDALQQGTSIFYDDGKGATHVAIPYPKMSSSTDSLGRTKICVQAGDGDLRDRLPERGGEAVDKRDLEIGT